MARPDQDEVTQWITTAAAEVVAKLRLEGEVWCDVYSDFGHGRLLSFGLRRGKPTEVHIAPSLATATPLFPVRLVLTADDQSSRAAWVREQSWDLAK